jgi:Tol biopolymer transport system component
MNASSPCFAADDRSIYWGGTTQEGNGRLFHHALDASAAPIGEVEVTLPVDAGFVEGVTIANNGAAAFAIRTQDANLWRIDIAADGRAGQPIRLTDDVARNTHAAYSHDGHLAHLQIPTGSRPSVWLMKDDGTDRAPLLAGTESFHPEWDRDDSRVLVVRPTGDGKAEFSWVDVASRRMTSAGLQVGDIRNARLSPDSQRIAFHRMEPDGTLSVWTGGFDGSRQRVASDRESVSYPVWSRDGKWLAMEMKRGDQTQLGVVSSAGGPVTQITTDRGQSWPHSWAPDNDRIVFAGQRDGVWNVYVVSRTTRATSMLTAYTSGSGYVRYPMWSPQGTRIVFERATESASVWTMTLPQAGQ